MNEYIKILQECILFKDFTANEITKFLNNTKNYQKKYQKNEVIINEGDNITFFNIVLQGNILIYLNDSNGNYFLKQNLITSNDFLHTFALTTKPSTCIVTALTDSTILYISASSIMNNNNELSVKFKNNLITTLAQKLYDSNERLSLLSAKTIREKIIIYLKRFDYENEKGFKIPLNRYQMAEYFSIPRTSLSRELIALKNEMILDYNKNHFKILNFDYFNNYN